MPIRCYGRLHPLWVAVTPVFMKHFIVNPCFTTLTPALFWPFPLAPGTLAGIQPHVERFLGWTPAPFGRFKRVKIGNIVCLCVQS